MKTVAALFLSVLAILAYLALGAFFVYLLTLSLSDLVAEPAFWPALRTFVFGSAVVSLVAGPFARTRE